MQCEPWIFNGERWVPEKPLPKDRGIHTVRDLDVFNLGYSLSMHLVPVWRKFPDDERYDLRSQIRRSSRGVSGAIVEGFAKRRHGNVFKNQLNDALGSSDETKLWLNYALDHDYISPEMHRIPTIGYEQLGGMIWNLMSNWRDFGDGK